MERIARDPALFTFLSQAPTPIDVVLGDGRKALEAEVAVLRKRLGGQDDL